MADFNLENPSVQAQVDPTTAKLGDLITLSIRVTHAPALQIDSPAFSKTLGTFEVYSSTRLASEPSGDRWVERFQASLQNFTTGPQVLSGLEVPFRDPMGTVHTVKTPELTVTITEVPAGPKDKGDIRGIKGVLGPTAWSPWWWVLAVAIVAVAGVLLWKKRRRVLEGPPPPPPIPADTLALDKLQKLAATDWLATGKAKEFYSALSDIVREYLEGAFRISALERTTSELMRDLRKSNDIPVDVQMILRELLDACDLVKFAKFVPTAEEGLLSHRTAVQLIEQTRAVMPAQAGIQSKPLDPGFRTRTGDVPVRQASTEGVRRGDVGKS